MKKKLLLISGIILSIFILFNAFWFIWREIKFNKYIVYMEPNVFSTIMVPRYYFIDEEGYTYYVKYPDYLSFSGNVTVMIPIEDDSVESFDNTLIIWVHFGGKYEYGMFIHEDDNVYQIYIDEQGNAIDSDTSEIIGRHKSDIEILLQKANKIWDIPIK